MNLDTRDWDERLMSEEDYQKLLGYKNDYRSAATDDERRKANQNAEELRAGYGYGRGSSGSDFWWLGGMNGVSGETGLRLRELQQGNPAGNSAWYDQWSSLYDQYAGRGPFTYDLTSDALYNQYKQQYTALGNQAMQDTMGQAAALTGGYGSSYGQNAGQQAYNSYMQQLNNLVPELYDRAYGQYQDEGSDLLNEAEMARRFYLQELSDYRDELSYWTDRADREQNRTDAERDRAVEQSRYDDEAARDRRDYDYKVRQDNYGNLVNAMAKAGYVPTDAELQAAGMTRAEAERWRQYYLLMQMK